MNDSHVISKEQCPECSKLGKDRSHDNLACFSDGHKFCFSCHYGEWPDGVARFLASDDVEATHETLTLPIDCDILYPERAVNWIKQYELTKNDLLNNNVMWSEQMQRLIFPVYGQLGALIAWQGRSFSLQDMAIAKIAKWFGRGNLKDTFNILGKGDKLILTEDIVSAIKVAKCGVMAMPLYGCSVGRTRFKRLYSLYRDTVEVQVWLDPDKRTEAIKEAHTGRVCGLNCRAVISSADPKEHSFEEIKEILQ